jgi:anaerobic selenocysteine-containing dehydrogenase
VYLNPGDAQRLSISEGQQVLLRTGGRELRVRAQVSDLTPVGVAVAPLQLAADGINVLGLAVDRVTRVDVRPVPAEGL